MPPWTTDRLIAIYPLHPLPLFLPYIPEWLQTPDRDTPVGSRWGKGLLLPGADPASNAWSRYPCWILSLIQTTWKFLSRRVERGSLPL